MKKIALCIILFTLLISKVNSQITFQKIFGDTGYTRAYSLILTSDGNYVMVGNNILTNARIFLIKLNVNGDTIWTRLYESSALMYCYDAKQTIDGGFIVTGTIGSLVNENIFLLKPDAVGNIVWTKIFGGSYNDRPYSVQQTPDGGFGACRIHNEF